MTLEEGYEIRYKYIFSKHLQVISLDTEEHVKEHLRVLDAYRPELSVLEVHTVRTEYSDVTNQFLKEAHSEEPAEDAPESSEAPA